MKKIIIVITIFMFLVTNILLSKNKYVKVTADNANIYIHSSVKSYLMKTVKKGTILNVFSVWKGDSRWINIRYRSLSGFVKTSQVTFVELQQATIGKKAPSKKKPVQKEQKKKKVEEKLLKKSENRETIVEKKPPSEKKPVQKEQKKKKVEEKLLRKSKNRKLITKQQKSPDIKKNKKFILLVRVDNYSPSEKIFKDIYGGGINYGGEIKISLWKGISMNFSFSIFSKKGEMTLLGEETKVNIIPIELGVLYKFLKKKINPYIGAGMGYYTFSEQSFLGKVTANNVGYFGQLGVTIYPTKSFLIDINAKYNFCNVKVGEIKSNIGGIRIGLGMGFCF